MLPLEETGKKKETMRTSLDVGEYQQRAKRGPILLGKRRSSQALSNPNDSQEQIPRTSWQRIS